MPGLLPGVVGCCADGQVAAADSAAQQAMMAPAVVQSWNLEYPIIGLAWLKGPGLAVVQEQGTRTVIYLYNQQGARAACRLDITKETSLGCHLDSECCYTIQG